MTNVDSVIITAATSSNEPIEIATKIARNKAKIVVVGDIPLNISRNDFYYKELELVFNLTAQGDTISNMKFLEKTIQLSMLDGLRIEILKLL